MNDKIGNKENSDIVQGDGEVTTCTFADIKLKIGDRLQVQPPPSIDKERRLVRLIGYVPNRSLIVTPPQANGLNLLLSEDDPMIVRVFTGHSAYGFATNVLKMCHYPYDYVHLAFPQVIQKLVIRKAVRVRVQVVASVQNPALGDPVAGMILDLSATGAMITTRQDVGKAGDVLNIKFRLKSNMIEADMALKATIRGVLNKGDDEDDEDIPQEEGPQDLRFRYGVEFTEVSVIDAATLKNAIFDLLM